MLMAATPCGARDAHRIPAAAASLVRMPPDAVAGPLVGILPARTRVEEALTRLRGCRGRLAVAPEDPAALRAMDDAAYALCVLMGRPTVHEDVLAAEAHLAHLAP